VLATKLRHTRRSPNLVLNRAWKRQQILFTDATQNSGFSPGTRFSLAIFDYPTSGIFCKGLGHFTTYICAFLKGL